jgi:MFS family permease
MDMRQIVRSVRFWFLMLTGFLIGVAATGSYLIFPSHAQQDGLSLLFVTSVLGVTMPLGNIIGKLIFGALTDRWGAGRAALIPFGANLVGVVAAVFMAPSAAPLAVVASLGIGFGISAPNLVPSLWVSELFGRKNSASILGYLMAFIMAGNAVTMPFSNLLFEKASSYAPALFVHAVSLGVILILNLSVLSRKSKRLPL